MIMWKQSKPFNVKDTTMTSNVREKYYRMKMNLYIESCGKADLWLCDGRKSIVADKDVQIAANTALMEASRTRYIKEMKDVWEAAKEGDCEDKCLWMIEVLRMKDFDNSIKFAIADIMGRRPDKEGLVPVQAHAVVVITTDQGDYVLDPRFAIPLPIHDIPKNLKVRYIHIDGGKWVEVVN